MLKPVNPAGSVNGNVAPCQLGDRLIEQGDDMVPGRRVGHERRRRRAGVGADVDRDLVLGVGAQDDGEVVRLERVGEAAHGALLFGGEARSRCR